MSAQLLMAMMGGRGPFPATVAPSSLSKTGVTSTITTSNCTASASGGTAPYTYQWLQDSDTGILPINTTASTSATTAFRIIGSASGDTGVGSWHCRITDSLGATGDTNSVSVSIDHT